MRQGELTQTKNQLSNYQQTMKTKTAEKHENRFKILTNKEISKMLGVSLSTARKYVKDIKKEYKSPKVTEFHLKKYFMIK